MTWLWSYLVPVPSRASPPHLLLPPRAYKYEAKRRRKRGFMAALLVNPPPSSLSLLRFASFRTSSSSCHRPLLRLASPPILCRYRVRALESSSAARKTDDENEEEASKNGEGFDSDGAVAEKTAGEVGEAGGGEFPVEEEFEMEEFDWWRRFVVKTRMLFALPWERVKKRSVLSMKLRGQVGLTGSPAFFSLFVFRDLHS